VHELYMNKKLTIQISRARVRRFDLLLRS